MATASAIAAAVYVALGALGLSFAVGPGYASPIFPAAGFAVAVLLWSNGRAWAGIWLGSLALNLGVSWLHDDFGPLSGLIAAGIACGSTAQALAARWLVVRSAKDGWRSLEAEGDIVRCLVFAGPIASIVSATAGVGILLGAHIIPAGECVFAWANWWSGDTLGVLVMLPISLTLLYRRDAPWAGRLTSLVLPMLITLGLVATASYAVAQWERSEQKLRIQVHGEALAGLLRQRFIAHKEALAALHRLIEVTPEMSYSQFEYFTRITLIDNPDIFALSVNPYVTLAQRQAFERSMAAKTGTAEFEIKERDSLKRLVRAADRADYVAVGYISPRAGNGPAVGFDINSEPVRRAAIEVAIRSNEPAVTAPIRLVQEDRKRVGALLLHPARREEVAPGRHVGTSGLIGFAVGVIKVDEMVEIATRSATVPGMVFQVRDSQAGSESPQIYRSESTAGAADPYYEWKQEVDIADRRWSLSVRPTAEFLGRHLHWVGLAVGAGGLALTALLQVLLLVATGRTAIVQRQVREQTNELDIARKAAEKASQLLREAVSSIAQGFTIYDENDRLIHCNEAYLRFYDASRDLIVIGATFETIIRQGAERGQYQAAVGRIDEWVSERVRQHQNANGEVFEQELSDGRWLMIVEYRTPSGYIVGNRVDITGRRQAEAVIRDRTEQLNAILSLSPDGFTSFDRNRRVKYVSPAFGRLTGLAETLVVGLDEAAFSEKLADLCIPSARFRGIDVLRPGGQPKVDGKPQHERIELSGPGGRVLEVSLRVSDAETVSQILCFRDITYETDVDRMKSEFLSTAAHELRTPMASIYGFAEVLLNKELDEATRRELLTIIHRQSEFMANILNELLDLARIEARRGKDFVFELVELNQLVAVAVSGYKVPEGRAGRVTTPSAQPLFARVDRSKIQQAVTNLLSNAYKYSPGGGAVSIGFATDAAADRSRVGIVVADQGVGMTPAQLARVCERFYRADTSGTILGTGLGMSIVKEIVEIHGGSLDLVSKVGAGTTVTIWLPAAAMNGGPPSSGASLPAPSTPESRS